MRDGSAAASPLNAGQGGLEEVGGRMVMRVGIGVALALASGGLGSVSEGEQNGVVSPAAVVTPYTDAKFAPLDPARPDGARIAVLRGDPTTGPSTMLMRMAKRAGVLHYHTADYELVVVEGQMKHWLEGQIEQQIPALGPGSYWYQPKMQPHADSCLSDSCVMFITWSGKRDAVRAAPSRAQ